MFYNIDIKAKAESDLSQTDLEKQLIITLRDTNNRHSRFGAVNNNLEIVDYDLMEAKEICPHCELELVPRMFDIDGTNLVEHDVCEECGYGTPALL